MSLYAIRELTLVRSGNPILDIPSLDIEKGRVCALLGPNGAGKTSLLSLLAFLDRPTSGTIRFDGHPVSYDASELRRFRLRVTLVDQRPVMFTASVADNVAFGLKTRSVPRDRRQAPVMEALEMVGMAAFANRRATSLSGGETQRVAIARAIACRPDVLLLDEPTANVDLSHQILIEEIIRRLWEIGGMSILLATHNLAQAHRLSQYRIHLLAGHLSLRTLENVFPTALVLENERFAALIPAISSGESFGETTATLHIQADGLGMVPAGPGKPDIPSGAGCVEATIMEVSAEDGHIRLLVDAGLPLTIRVPRSVFEARRLTVGDRPWVICPPSAVSVNTDPG